MNERQEQIAFLRQRVADLEERLSAADRELDAAAQRLGYDAPETLEAHARRDALREDLERHRAELKSVAPTRRGPRIVGTPIAPVELLHPPPVLSPYLYVRELLRAHQANTRPPPPPPPPPPPRPAPAQPRAAGVRILTTGGSQ